MAEPTRPRVLLVTRNLPPLVGGMERLNWHVVNELSQVAELHAIGPHGAASLAPAGVEMSEAPLRPLWRFLLYAQWLALRRAFTFKPQVILAGSGLTAPVVWLAARLCGARAIAYLHGLDICVPHPVYRRLWLPFMRRMDRLLVNSRATAAMAAETGCDPARVAIVHPGVALPDVRTEGADGMAFRISRGLDARPILLSVGRLTRRKGLQEFVVRAMPRIVSEMPDVLLLVVGDVPGDALHASGQQTMESIETAAASVGVGPNVRFVGRLDDVTLAAAYQSADVHVFPVRHVSGDPEGFGMVAVEAAAHGTPTVAFANGGVVDAVADGLSGWLVAPDDYDAFAETVINAMQQKEAMQATCRQFAAGFAWSKFGAEIAHQILRMSMASSSSVE